MWWDPCLSHEHPTAGHQGLQHPSDTLDITWESPSQALASCGRAGTQETFPPAELMRVNAFACSEFPRIFTCSQVPNLSTKLLPLKKKKKQKQKPNPSPKKKAGGKVGRVSEFCSSLLPPPRVEHSGPHPKVPSCTPNPGVEPTS